MTLAELGMPSVPSVLAIPRIQDTLDAEGVPTGGHKVHGLDRFLDEFAWYADALRLQRASGTPY